MNIPPLDTPEDDFWAWVQQSYMVSPNIINLWKMLEQRDGIVLGEMRS